MWSVASGFGKVKNDRAKKKSRLAPNGKRIAMVRTKDFFEILRCSEGTSQNRMTRIGTIKRSRLTVYSKGDEAAMGPGICGDTRAVCRVRAEGRLSMIEIMR